MGLSGLLPAEWRQPVRKFRLDARIGRQRLTDLIRGTAGRFAKDLHPAVMAGGEPADAGFPVTVSGFSAPIINPLYQAHVYANKMHNLGLVRDRMHGLVIPPGGVFSFWHLLGPPDEAHGFREASAMIDLELTTAMGGGLCQLSGVIFNAALLAGCTILERIAHSMDVYGEGRYIPLGRDATVVWGWKDVRFANPHPRPLLLTIEIRPDLATARMHAPAELFKAVRVEVEESAPVEPTDRLVPDPTLAAGERKVEFAGYVGRRTVTRRIVTGLDGVERVDLIGRDAYRMMPRVVKIGGAS